MENGWSLFNDNGASGTGSSRGQKGNCNNLAWDICELGGRTSRFDGGTASATNNNSFHQDDAPPTATAMAATTTHPLMGGHTSVYAGARSHFHPDPHLMCLKLGKKHYFEDATPTPLGDRHVGVTKRGRPTHYGGGVVGSPAAVPRCQVDGCEVGLVNAKEYHRRHKVCEMHSKAAEAVVRGVDQRFCQQCSRFHAVSEFDDTKRSCRRRLAGHNQRRRKGSLIDSSARNPFHGRALSHLSSKNNSWLSSSNLSSRCSAALCKLIPENCAALNGSQPGSNSVVTTSPHHQMFPEPHSWDRFNEGGGHVTLDLMQARSSAFGFLSVKEKSKRKKSVLSCGCPLGVLM